MVFVAVRDRMILLMSLRSGSAGGVVPGRSLASLLTGSTSTKRKREEVVSKMSESTRNKALEELKRDVRKWLEEDRSPPPKKAAGNICASLGVKESDDEVAEGFIKRAISCCDYRTEQLKTLLPRLTRRELLIVFNFGFFVHKYAHKYFADRRWDSEYNDRNV